MPATVLYHWVMSVLFLTDKLVCPLLRKVERNSHRSFILQISHTGTSINARNVPTCDEAKDKKIISIFLPTDDSDSISSQNKGNEHPSKHTSV